MIANPRFTHSSRAIETRGAELLGREKSVRLVITSDTSTSSTGHAPSSGPNHVASLMVLTV